MKPHKRNLSYLDTMNKSSIKINNNNFYQDKNILFNRNNNIKLRNYNNIAIPNFITYKNNIVHIKQKIYLMIQNMKLKITKTHLNQINQKILFCKNTKMHLKYIIKYYFIYLFINLNYI